MKKTKLTAYFLVTILAALSSGCAALENYRNWQDHKSYTWAYQEALDVLASALPHKTIKQCGFIFNAPVPPTTPVRSEYEMMARFGMKARGMYVKDTKEVFYVREANSDTTLVHEYMHYIYDISNINEKCKNQTIAYLVAYSYNTRLSFERWKRSYERERSRNADRRH